MNPVTRKITKVLAVEEDINYGEGNAKQLRSGTNYPVNLVRTLRPVNNVTELTELDPERFPKAAMVYDGQISFFQHNGEEYEQLVANSKTVVVEAPIAAISAIGKETVIISSSEVHSLSYLNNGTLGQFLNIVSTTSNTTISNSPTISLIGGVDKPLTPNTGVRLICTGSVWAEV